MKIQRLFVSHSSDEKPFAEIVVQRLAASDLAPWIDKEQIITGDNVFDSIGDGLQTMDMLLFLASKNSLQSEWVKLELQYAVKREITEKKALVVPCIIDDTPIESLPWFLQVRNICRVDQTETGADRVAEEVRKIAQRRFHAAQEELKAPLHGPGDLEMEHLLKKVVIEEPDSWQPVAWQIVRETDVQGKNKLFNRLVTYLDSSDEEPRWRASVVIETIAQLNPSLITESVLRRMAADSSFSVRSSAAMICYYFSQSAPGRVPLDILENLARFDEDWYVSAPAMGALKTLVRVRPAAQRVLFVWLESEDKEEREHAAHALSQIAKVEPEVLTTEKLESACKQLKALGDDYAARLISESLRIAKKTDIFPFRYSAF